MFIFAFCGGMIAAISGIASIVWYYVVTNRTKRRLAAIAAQGPFVPLITIHPTRQKAFVQSQCDCAYCKKHFR